MGCLCWSIVDNPPNQTTSLALMVLGSLATLACVTAIGAATVLVVIALDDPAPGEAVASYDRDCALVAWKSGSIRCFRNIAQADPAR
jgi:hypothetical protein